MASPSALLQDAVHSRVPYPKWGRETDAGPPTLPPHLWNGHSLRQQQEWHAVQKCLACIKSFPSFYFPFLYKNKDLNGILIPMSDLTQWAYRYWSSFWPLEWVWLGKMIAPTGRIMRMRCNGKERRGNGKVSSPAVFDFLSWLPQFHSILFSFIYTPWHVRILFLTRF